MKRLLIAAAALSAMAAAAAAQPAYTSSEGAAPAQYPRCTHRGQDRCVNHGWGHPKAAAAAAAAPGAKAAPAAKASPARAPAKSGHSTTDGERG